MTAAAPHGPGAGLTGCRPSGAGVPVTEDRPNAVSVRTAQTAAEPSRGAGAGGQLGTDRCPRLPRAPHWATGSATPSARYARSREEGSPRVRVTRGDYRSRRDPVPPLPAPRSPNRGRCVARRSSGPRRERHRDLEDEHGQRGLGRPVGAVADVGPRPVFDDVDPARSQPREQRVERRPSRPHEV